jgi:hypothetical protein
VALLLKEPAFLFLLRSVLGLVLNLLLRAHERGAILGSYLGPLFSLVVGPLGALLLGWRSFGLQCEHKLRNT